MADGIGIRVRADAALKNWSKNVIPHFRNVVTAAVQSMGFNSATRAQANAPIDTGDLRRSLKTENQPKVIVRSGAGAEITAEFLVTASEPYALKMHEQLTPFGRFQLGPLSREQPATREGGVGGKYVARAIEKNVKRLEKLLGRVVESNLGGAVKSVKVTVRPTPQS